MQQQQTRRTQQHYQETRSGYGVTATAHSAAAVRDFALFFARFGPFVIVVFSWMGAVFTFGNDC